jgi:alcohol dehydrogenase (cytochrome c)
VPEVLQKYAPVTEARLKNPEESNWLMVTRTYDGWGYSPLKQITTGNVTKLKPVWSFSTGETRGHESAPVVNNGVMFVTTPMSQVIALDAKTGALLWRYRRVREAGTLVPHETNRGVALYGDKVYFASGDAVLVALDAKTGQGSVDDDRRGQQVCLLHHARAAGCRWQGDGRRIGRRVRHPRIHRGIRSGNRQGAVAHLYDSRSR